MIKRAIAVLVLASQLRAITFSTNSINVVQSANPSTAVLEAVIGGPTIANGFSPWLYEEQQEALAVQRQRANNVYQGSPIHINGVGTVRYNMYDGHVFGGPPGTNLTSAITTISQTSIAIANASVLDLSSLPTAVIVDTEMIRVCAASATSGAATLTACYDGRGISNATTLHPGQLSAAATHSNGAIVYQFPVVGASTQFHSDTSWGAQGALASSIPGPPGPVVYSAGLATPTPGSTTISTFGAANWSVVFQAANATQGASFVTVGSSSAGIFIGEGVSGAGIPLGTIVTSVSGLNVGISNPTAYGLFGASLTFGVAPGYMIALTNATHSGSSFPWWAMVMTNSSGTITTSRPFPADADAGSYTYTIISPRYVSLEFADPGSFPHTGGVGRGLFEIEYVEDETHMYGIAGSDISAFTAQGGSLSQSGVHYTYKDILGAQSSFGPNFYGQPSLNAWIASLGTSTAANALSMNIDYVYASDPELFSGTSQYGSPLQWGGGLYQAFQRKSLDSADPVQWGDLRWWGLQSIHSLYGISAGCNASDSRNHPYAVAPLGFLALYDPDPTWQAYWLSNAATELARAQHCIRNAADGYTGAALNSFANSYNWTARGPTLSISSGSSNTGTGTSLTSTYPAGLGSICNGSWTGTVTVVNGSSTATVASTTHGSLPLGGNTDTRIWISDNAGYTLPSQYSLSGSTITLSGVFQGVSGTYASLAESVVPNPLNLNAGMLAIANSDTDSLADNTQLQKNYGCYIVNSTTVLFDRATGLNGSGYQIDSFNVSGFNQQPYMVGIVARVLRLYSNIPGPTGAGFATLLPLVGAWMTSYGFDPYTLGTSYGAPVSSQCTQAVPSAVGNNLFSTIQGTPNFIGCGYNQVSPVLGNGEETSRIATAEALIAYIEDFRAGPTIAKMLFIDKVYSLWANPSLTQAGIYSDPYFAQTTNELFGTQGFKWPGFFFGPVASPRVWPAIRAQFLAQAAQTFHYNGKAWINGKEHN